MTDCPSLMLQIEGLNLRAFDCYFILKGHKDCYCVYDAEPGTKTLMSFHVERKSTDTQSKDVPQSEV